MPEAAAERIGIESYFGISDFTKNTKIYETTLRGLEKSTAKYGKSVEKSTTGAEDSWEHYVRNLSKLTDVQQREIDDMRQTLAKFTQANRKSTEQAATSWEQFSGSVIGQVAKVKASIDAAKFAINAFIQPFKKFMAIGMEAVGLQRTQERFRDLVGGVEEYEEAMVEMREATQGTIRDTQLIDSAFNILRRGYAQTAASAATLARNIQLTAQMAGQVPTMESAMQVFSLMMSNQSKMRVDAFGLTIEQVDNRIAHLQETLGTTEEAAFGLAIVQLLDEQVGDLGLTAETSTTKINRMTAEFGNLGDSLKTMVVPIFNDFVDIITSWASKVNINIESVKGHFAAFVGTVRGLVAQAGESLQALVFGLMAVKEAITGNEEAMLHYANLTRESLNRVINFVPLIEAVQHELDTMYGDTSDAAQDSADAQVQALSEVEQAWADLAKATQQYEDELAKVAAEATAKAAADMIKEFWKVQDAAIAAARRRVDIARQTAAKIQAIEQQLAAAISKAYMTYQESIRRIDKQNADQRLQIEEDYQKRKRDIMRRFELSEEQAIRDRDALALSNARAQRDTELQDAEEQRNEQMEKANKSYQDQLQSAKNSLNQQLQAAEDAYNQQLIKLQQSLKEQEEQYQLAQRRKEEDKERADAREEGQRKTAHGKKINEIYLANREELNIARQHYNSLTVELRRYYDNVVQYYNAIARITGSRPAAGRPVSRPRRQMGGYAMPGAYNVSESGTEFVMNASTTAAMGKAFGGAISQMGLQRLASSLQPQAMNVNHNVSGDISGTIDVAVRRGISGMEGRLMAALDRQMRGMFKVR